MSRCHQLQAEEERQWLIKGVKLIGIKFGQKWVTNSACVYACVDDVYGVFPRRQVEETSPGS